MLRRVVATTVFVLSWATSGYAAERSWSDRRLYVGTGLAFQNLYVTSGDATAASTFKGAQYWNWVLQWRPALGENWRFPVTLAMNPVGRSTLDGAAQARWINGMMQLSRGLGPFDLRAGWGMSVYWLKGSGGTAELRNGTSTATFALPSLSSWSRDIHVNFGVGLRIWLVRIDADVLVSGMLSSRRTLGGLMSVMLGTF